MQILGDARNLRSIVTRKSMLPPPASRTDPKWEASWRHLFERYDSAMVRYVRSLMTRFMRRSVDAQEAEDVVQAYLSKALEKGWLARDGEEIRCFRAYLQTQLRRFVHDHLDHVFAQKRKSPGDASPDVLQGVADEDSSTSTLEFDEGWVKVAVDLALAQLKAKNDLYFEVIADLIRTDGEGSPDLGERLGRQDRQLDDLRYRARRRFTRIFNDQLRLTVRDDEAFDSLLQALAPHMP